MKKKLYRALTVLLILILAVSGVMAVRDQMDRRVGEDAYEEAARVAGLARIPAAPAAPAGQETETSAAEEEDPLAALEAVDLTALRELNPEVVGWIEIPDTGISYPLLQGDDNQYYLKHTWLGDSSSVGAIFMEETNSPDLSDFNTIVYGHKLRSGAMFAGLLAYESPDFCKEHPSVYIVDDAGLHRYDVFAAHAVGVREIVYRLDLAGEARQEEFIQFCLDRSVIDTGIVPELGDRILTLSTCTGNGYSKRWVVQAVLREDAPEAQS